MRKPTIIGFIPKKTVTKKTEKKDKVETPVKTDESNKDKVEE